MSPFEGTMKTFFNSIKEQRYDDSYRLLSKRLKLQTSQLDLHKFIKEYKLYKVENTRWHGERTVNFPKKYRHFSVEDFKSAIRKEANIPLKRVTNDLIEFCHQIVEFPNYIRMTKIQNQIAFAVSRNQVQLANLNDDELFQLISLYKGVKDQVSVIFGTVVLSSGFSMSVEAYGVLEQDDQSIYFGNLADFSDIPFANNLQVWKIDYITIRNKPPSSS